MAERRYKADEVARLRAAGGLTRWQVYALEHQHPLNQLSHFLGIPTILFGIAWPLYLWLRTGEVAWELWLGCQVAGWVLQLAGHGIEGNRPAFLGDPAQLAIGPLFFLLKPVAWLRGRPVVELPDPPAASAQPLSPSGGAS